MIRGWDEGLLGACVKEKRTLTIPSELAYGASIILHSPVVSYVVRSIGSRGAGGVIPPNAALVFTTELLGIHGKRDEL